jgi:cytochrome o ubiquinol oxidase subunit 1
MVIGGALFGIFAGITYWFPKVIGFKLNERIGRYAFWSWIIGFLVSFIPLYILGFMGATRRLETYPAETGWQPLFMASFIGSLIISFAVGLQILQLIVSIWQRKQNADTTGDPWNGRNLEWATSSPPPFYNFAVVPKVTGRDAFWEMKKNGLAKTKQKYEDIEMPRNTAMGIYIAMLIFLVGFAMVWHIYWLAAAGIAGAIICVIIRTFDENTEYTLSASDVAKIEALRSHGKT